MKKLILLFVFTITSVVSFAYDFEVNGIYYNKLSDNKCEVTYKYYNVMSYSGIVVIRKEVTYGGKTYSVTSIGDYAFCLCSGLTSVTIPNSVTSIGNYAFNGCSDLTSVTIPNSVTSIGEDVFAYCSGLTSLTIPNSVTSIGSNAFRSCYRLTSVTIPNSVTSIGESAFDGCSGLTSVTIPNSVTSIGSSAFNSCSGLTSVTIPNSVTSIGNSAFRGCSRLTSLTIPNSVTSIGSNAFSYCKGLTSVTLGNSVTSIGSSAFWGCSGLTSFTIPNSVTSIGESAFQGCSGLTSVTIPNSVTSIGNYAFDSCSYIKSVHISSIESWCNIKFGTYSANPLYNGGQLILNNEPVSTLVIPNSVTSIGGGAFYKCSGLTSVTIPNSVTSIGECAFYKCSGLSNVTVLHATPLSINSNVFSYTPSVKTLHVYNGLKDVYAKANVWKDFSQIIDDVPRPDKPTRVVFDKDEYYIKLDESGYFKPHTEPSEYESIVGVKYKYSVDNPDVLIIDPNTGQYYGYSDGVATVTVRVENLNLEASVKVYVGTGKPDPKPDPEPEKCATPVISIVDGEVIATCETEGAVCHITTRMNANTPSGDDSVMPTAVLTVTAYATADSYNQSETATKEFDLMKLQGDGGVRGDTNGDGQVTVTDIVKTAGYILTGEWGE